MNQMTTSIVYSVACGNDKPTDHFTLLIQVSPHSAVPHSSFELLSVCKLIVRALQYYMQF